MVEIIYGRARSGKTYAITEKINNAVKSGKECVLVVPEQYTLESERELLQVMGNSAADIPVLSFTRMYETVSAKVGGLSGVIATDSDRVILMSRALESVREHLKYWVRRKATPEFCGELITAVNEFKTCAFPKENLEEIKNSLAKGRLRDKLEDIMLISEAYETLLSVKYIDPMDNLKKLYDMLATCDYFKGKQVFFDSFKGFTGQQFMVISRIIDAAENCTFSFASNGDFGDETGVFATVNSAVRKIISISKSVGAEIKTPVCVGEPRYNSPDIAALEAYFSKREKSNVNPENINICFCRDANEEAAYAAEIIRKLVREQSYRFRDFVVIARNAELYSAAVSAQFEKCSVPIFMDYRIPAATLPLLIFADSAVKTYFSFNTENILRFVKSGISPLNDTEICDLENYVFIWRIDGKKWLDTWDMDPEGMNFREKQEKNNIEKQLEYINSLRLKAISPLLKFKKNFCGSAADMGRALFALAEECKAREKLESLISEYESIYEFELSENTRMSWEVFCDILDSTVSCMEGNSVEEFESVWDCALSFATVGRTPQRPDEVVFGAADRIRPSRPKIVIVLGMNRDVFPASVSSGGIFAANERAELISRGVPLADRAIDDVLDENFLVYNSLCCASDKLFVTYSASLGGDYSCQPSRTVDMLKNLFESIKVKNYADIIRDADFVPETKESAVTRMAMLMKNGGELFDSINSVLTEENSGETVSVILENAGESDVRDIQEKMRKKQLSPDTSEKLYGKDIYLSATKFDKFNRCKFAYFCDFGIKAKVLKQVDIDVKQKGLIIHYVLEKMFTRFGKEITNLSDDAVQNEVSKYIKEYLNGISGTDSISNAKFNFMLSKIETITCDIVCHLCEEFKQSKFEPVACELSIGPDSEVIPPEIKLNNGGEIHIIGSIDRVDRFNNYIRVIDYKTGTKTFKLPDIVYGLNMQMLLYLYSVTRSNDEKYGGTNPAGVLYLPAKRSFDGENSLCASGVVLDDESVAAAMEAENGGVYIPKRTLDKNGNVKGEKYLTAAEFEAIFSHLEKKLKEMGNQLHSGNVEVNPTDGCESDACKYCDFYSVCLLRDGEHKSVEKLTKSEVFEIIGGEEGKNEV